MDIFGCKRADVLGADALTIPRLGVAKEWENGKGKRKPSSQEVQVDQTACPLVGSGNPELMDHPKNPATFTTLVSYSRSS